MKNDRRRPPEIGVRSLSTDERLFALRLAIPYLLTVACAVFLIAQWS